MSRRRKPSSSVGNTKNLERTYNVMYSGRTHTGKTYGYLDILNHPAMEGKNMGILATDTIENITENIDLDEYKHLNDRIVFLLDENDQPIKISKDKKTAENSVNKMISMIERENIGCIVLDNYDEVEEMYIQDYKDSKGAEKLMSYDYGVPRTRAYINFIRPFLNMNIHFILTTDVKEIYAGDNPTGRFESTLPYRYQRKFTEIIFFNAINFGTPKYKVQTWINKWKGLREPVDLGGHINVFTEIESEVNKLIKKER